MTGIIVYYLPAKGYGYVRVPGTHEEFYFRTHHLRQPVQAGDHVQFQLKEGPQGYYADEIELLQIS